MLSPVLLFLLISTTEAVSGISEDVHKNMVDHNNLRVPVHTVENKNKNMIQTVSSSLGPDEEGKRDSSADVGFSKERILEYEELVNAKWYVVWENLYCAQDCPESGPGSYPTCNRLAEDWQTLYPSAEACCDATLSWQPEDKCVKHFGHPKNLMYMERFSESSQKANGHNGGGGGGSREFARPNPSHDTQKPMPNVSRNPNCLAAGRTCGQKASSLPCCRGCNGDGYCA